MCKGAEQNYSQYLHFVYFSYSQEEIIFIVFILFDNYFDFDLTLTLFLKSTFLATPNLIQIEHLIFFLNNFAMVTFMNHVLNKIKVS